MAVRSVSRWRQLALHAGVVARCRRFAFAASLILAACEADEPARAPSLDAEAPSQTADDGASSALDASLEPGRDGAQAGSEAGPLDAAFVGSGEPGRLLGITFAHNAARARVATSPVLAELTWSTSIAAVAQAYADKLAAACADTLLHSSDDERRGYGENLASFTSSGGSGQVPNGSAARVVELWESEVDCYTYGPFESGVNATCSAGCADYGGCGHYTQLVWRQTQRLGCGLGECTQGKTRKSYWVCHYDPPGNFLGSAPY
jgi:pathogenesis-related protein 1